MDHFPDVWAFLAGHELLFKNAFFPLKLELSGGSSSFDLITGDQVDVFGSWLLGYLSTETAKLMMKRIWTHLKSGSTLILRENVLIGDDVPFDSAADLQHIRSTKWLLSNLLSTGFEIIQLDTFPNEAVSAEAMEALVIARKI